MNSNEQWILNNLNINPVDLSDFKSKNQEWGSILSPYNGRSSNLQHQLQMENNDKLLKNFKELKDKLKIANKENQTFKFSIAQKQSEVVRCKANQKQMIKKVYQLNKENKQLKALNQEYKNKLQFAKEYVKSKKEVDDQLQIVKLALAQNRQLIKTMELQKKKNLQLSIIEKLQLQQKVKKAEATMRSDHNYIQDMEIQLHKVKQQNLKLQAQLKKLEIKYDQEIYNKKWINHGYEKQELERIVRQMEKEISTFNEKHNKEKQRKSALQKRVLQLQQISGLWTVKAETYENQILQMSKKMKKCQKKMNDAIYKADQASTQSIYWQQRFLKSVAISEQLIARVKRQMIGDLVTLAKSCQFKIIKLKQQDKVLKNALKKSPSVNKHSLSKGRSKSVSNSYTPTRKLFQNLVDDKGDDYPRFKHEQNKNQDNNRTTEIKRCSIPNTRFGIQEKYNFLNQERTNLFMKKDDKQVYESNFYNSNHNPIVNQTVKKVDVQSKIRKQREQMQRKLRQKMMYNRIEFVGSSPQRHLLRSQYLKMMDI